MILIAHRGNINGSGEYENGQKYCQEAIDDGYNVEIDVWYTDTWWTGHDRPQYRVDPDFLLKKEVWCHAKNIEALKKLLELGAHCFFHQNDPVTLTSKQYIWTYPTQQLTEKSICVLPELQAIEVSAFLPSAGVCSDFIERYGGLK
mgnify:CR=1 FL=1|jgi:hypothetical protein|tara:strand:+ start:1536 stop:1973 length:438 start_codon:yes stop_codon:yes gene_type:complete